MHTLFHLDLLENGCNKYQYCHDRLCDVIFVCVHFMDMFVSDQLSDYNFYFSMYHRESECSNMVLEIMQTCTAIVRCLY